MSGGEGKIARSKLGATRRSWPRVNCCVSLLDGIRRSDREKDRERKSCNRQVQITSVDRRSRHFTYIFTSGRFRVYLAWLTDIKKVAG
jgi:hypothetical protein